MHHTYCRFLQIIMVVAIGGGAFGQISANSYREKALKAPSVQEFRSKFEAQAEKLRNVMIRDMTERLTNLSDAERQAKADHAMQVFEVYYNFLKGEDVFADPATVRLLANALDDEMLPSDVRMVAGPLIYIHDKDPATMVRAIRAVPVTLQLCIYHSDGNFAHIVGQLLAEAEAFARLNAWNIPCTNVSAEASFRSVRSEYFNILQAIGQKQMVPDSMAEMLIANWRELTYGSDSQVTAMDVLRHVQAKPKYERWFIEALARSGDKQSLAEVVREHAHLRGYVSDMVHRYEQLVSPQEQPAANE